MKHRGITKSWIIKLAVIAALPVLASLAISCAEENSQSNGPPELGNAWKQAMGSLCREFETYKDNDTKYYWAKVRFYKVNETTQGDTIVREMVVHDVEKGLDGVVFAKDVLQYWEDGEYPIVGLPKGTADDPRMLVKMSEAVTADDERTFTTISVADGNATTTPYTLEKSADAKLFEKRFMYDNGDGGDREFYQGYDVETSDGEKLPTFYYTVQNEEDSGADLYMPCFAMISETEGGLPR